MKNDSIMTKEEQKTVIRRYAAAYNAFDIDGMIALVHPDIVLRMFPGARSTLKQWVPINFGFC
jgi:hypothetical protein